MAEAASVTSLETIGYRVVRGPAWKWGKLDGGDGHVGTVRSFESSDEVLVLWDNGMVGKYRFTVNSNLRVLDSGPAGIRHRVSCNSCSSTEICGIRWSCLECPNVNLCSVCYHSDKYNVRHAFCRMTTAISPRVAVPCRRKAKKITSHGILPGARVVRGVDWQWEEQDGGMGRKGKVTELVDWNSGSLRSAVYVMWESNRRNLYRLGFEGRCDLKAVTAGKGALFYKEHLPLFGEREGPQQTPHRFRVGDRVKVSVEMDIVRTLQTGHGGWSDGMVESVGSMGTVVGLDEDHDVVVKYASNNRWTFNPAVLKKVSVGEAPPRLSLVLPEDPFMFQRGYFVKVTNNLEQMMELQPGHGEWVDTMKQILGKVGRVVDVYSDGDLQVEITGVKWTFNPKNVSMLEGDGPPLTPDTSEGVSLMLRQMFETHRASDPVEDMVNAAVTGDVGKVQQLLDEGACGVDDQFNGKTALVAAAQNGHLDVVHVLIQYNASLEKADKDGNRVVHHATLGDEPDVIALLATHEADLNTRNQKKQTPLHVAVNKGHVTVIKVLLKECCHCSLQDLEGDTPLHDAISKKRDDMVQLLLEAQADISATNNNDFNCLHHAALRGNIGAVRLILAHLPPSCSVNESKDDGFTALHLAALNNHLEVAQMLLANGANLDIQNINLQTPLHLAVERNNIQIVRLLVEEGANMDLGDKFGDSPLHEALRHHTMSHLKQMQEANDVGKALVTNSSDKKSSASITIFLASNGADIYLKNFKEQTPLDLCPDPHLLKLLTRCNLEHHSTCTTQPHNDNPQNGIPVKIRVKEEDFTDCSVCQKKKRDMLFVPCGHVTSCEDCALTMETCSMCQEEIATKVKIEECLVCSGLNASVLFKPCLHMVACDSCSLRMKKCVQCRTPIEKFIPFSMCCGGKPSKFKRERSGSYYFGSSGGQDDVITLQHQLQEIKDKTQCQVCMDRRKNCVFLCGHGTCQLCADQITECPICRKTVEKKIILFD